MKYFHYTGYGAYSDYFNWDEPVILKIDNEVDETAIERIEEEANCKGCFAGSYSDIVGAPKYSINHYFYNRHGGTIEERGFVAAETKKEAEWVIDEYNYFVKQLKKQEELYQELTDQYYNDLEALERELYIDENEFRYENVLNQEVENKLLGVA